MHADHHVLPDALGETVNQRAAGEGRTYPSVVTEALRSPLDEQAQTSTTPTSPLPSYGDPDGRVLIDLPDRDALAEALDTDGLR